MLPAGLLPAEADAIVQQAVDQALLDAKVLECKRAGRDFGAQFQFTSPGQPLVIIDEPHKLKTAKPQDNSCCCFGKLESLASMQRAAGVVSAGSVPLSDKEAAARAKAAACQNGEACLDQGVLLAVAGELEREYEAASPAERTARYGSFTPRALLAILRGDTDAQSVACAQYWLGCKPLQQALRARGFVRTAVVMRTLMEAFEAFDESGLEPVERALCIVRRSFMLQRLLGNTLLTARLHRGSGPATLPSHIHGFTLSNIISWLVNGDARLEALLRLPEGWRTELCERSFSSDCCELFFSLLVNLCGGKPSVRVIKGAMRRLAFMHRLRQVSRAARGFSMRKRRTRGAYKEHELLLAATLQESAGAIGGAGGAPSKWNCAAKIVNEALRCKRQGAIEKRVASRVRGKAGSLRSVLFLKQRLQA